eukprot:m.55312 g.55312  ORF g.55312 m.55312 type:complete len:300 (-) comp11122_c0_seq2:366-1265(-)
MNTIASGILSSPLFNVKTLIKFGYEPIPEFSARSWFGKEGYARLSFISYALALKKEYGFGSLFRGSFLVGVGNVIIGKVEEVGTAKILERTDSKEEEKSWYSTIATLAAKTVSLTVGLILTQPLRVVVRNMVASIVDSNDMYNTTIGTFKSIYNEFGIGGFFRGFFGDWLFTVLDLWLVGVGLYFITSQKFLEEYQNSLRNLGSMGEMAADNLPTLVVATIVAYLVHPIHVATCMTSIAGSKLMLANAPYQPANASLTNNYQFLLDMGGYFNPRAMFRGASGLLFSRWHRTPFDITKRE